MKKILLFLLCLISISGYAQVHWNKVYSYNEYLGLHADSVLLPPGDTLSTAPVGALATLNNHVYQKNSVNVWMQVDGGGSGSYTADEITLHLNGSNQFSINTGYIGQSSITTLGTIVSGIWNSTPITDTYIASSANWNAKLGSTLTSAQIFVGNGSNIATGVTPSGDWTIDNAGHSTVTALRGRNIATTAPTNGQIYAWNSTSLQWEPVNPSSGSGAPFNDNVALVQNNADNTRKLIFSAASVPTGTTNTWTFPGVNGTVARNDAAQTFSGVQTLSNPPIFTGLTGFLKGNGSSAITASSTVANSDLATMANITVKANVSGSTAAPQDVSASSFISSFGLMQNLGTAPGWQTGAYSTLPAATSMATGTHFTATDSGFILVDTGSGGSRGWKLLTKVPQTFNLWARQGLKALHNSSDTIALGTGGNPLTEPDTLDFGYEPFLIQHVTSESSLAGGDSAIILSSGDQMKKVPTSAFGGGAGTPGGSTTQVQYNNSGAFAGSSGMTYNGTALSLTAAPIISALTAGEEVETDPSTNALASQAKYLHPPVNVATTLPLPANTYSNGTAGVGATLTGAANGALLIDGISVASGNRVLVKDETTRANNGIYTVTQVGDPTHPYILTRGSYSSVAANMAQGSHVFVQSGVINANTTWYQQTGGSVTFGTTVLPYSSAWTDSSLYSPVTSFLVPDSLDKFGHSVIFGLNATVGSNGTGATDYPDSSFFGRTLTYMNQSFKSGITAGGIAVSGTGMITAAGYMDQYIQPTSTAAVIAMSMINDLKKNGATRLNFNKQINGVKDMFANMYLASFKAWGDGTVTRYGSGWTTGFTAATTAGGKTNTGLSSGTVNDSAVTTITGTTVVIGMVGELSGLGSVDVYIDQVKQETFSLNNATDGMTEYVSGPFNSTYFPVVRIYSGLSAGSHSVKIIHSVSGTIYLDYVGTLKAPGYANNNLFIFCHEMHVTATGLSFPPANVSNAGIDSANALIDSLRAAVAPLGFPFFVAHINKYYNIASADTSFDDTHPSAQGHYHMYQAVVEAMSGIGDSAMRQGNVFFGGGQLWSTRVQGKAPERFLTKSATDNYYVWAQTSNPQPTGFNVSNKSYINNQLELDSVEIGGKKTDTTKVIYLTKSSVGSDIFFGFKNTAAPANQQKWRYDVGSNGTFSLLALSDNESTVNSAFQINKSGANISNVSFPNTVLGTNTTGANFSATDNTAGQHAYDVTGTSSSILVPFFSNVFASGGSTMQMKNTSTASGAFTDLYMQVQGSGSGSAYIDMTDNTTGNGIRFGMNPTSGNDIFDMRTAALPAGGVSLFSITQSGNVSINGSVASGTYFQTRASTASNSTLNIPTGTYPTSPNQGDLGAVTGHLYYRDGSTTYDLLSPGGASFYQTVQSNTISQTQRGKLNFSTDFTVADNGGNGSTDVSISTSKVNSGIYVPTATGLAFVTSVTADSSTWTRVGNIVTVYGSMSVTPSANNSTVNISITLPVTSLLNGGHALWGSGTTEGAGAGNSVYLVTYSTNHIAELVYTSGTSASGIPTTILYSYQYQVQ